MKPVIIFRHAAVEGPGYLAEFLDEKAIPWHLIKIDQGDELPQSMNGFSGMFSAIFLLIRALPLTAANQGTFIQVDSTVLQSSFSRPEFGAAT